MAQIPYADLPQPVDPPLSALGGDWKGKVSPLLYGLSIIASFWSHWMAQGIYVLVALLWLVPDRRLERAVRQEGV